MHDTRKAIATSHGRHYFRFAKALHVLGLRFDSIIPSDVYYYDGDIVLCTRNETMNKPIVPVIHDDVSYKHPVVLFGLILKKLNKHARSDTLILGIDPGSRTGLSIFYAGHEIGLSFHTPIDDLIQYMIEIISGLDAKKKIIRIGSGNMKITRKICAQFNLHFCSSFELELVNEYGTTPKSRNLNRRGKRDMFSARSIAQRHGFKQLVTSHSIAS